MEKVISLVSVLIGDAGQELQNAKETILNAVAESNFDVASIASAKAKGNQHSLAILNTALSIIQKNASDEKAAVTKTKDYIIHVMITGAGDMWSGRENDMRRTAHDIVLSYISKVQDILQYDI